MLFLSTWPSSSMRWEVAVINNQMGGVHHRQGGTQPSSTLTWDTAIINLNVGCMTPSSVFILDAVMWLSLLCFPHRRLACCVVVRLVSSSLGLCHRHQACVIVIGFVSSSLGLPHRRPAHHVVAGLAASSLQRLIEVTMDKEVSYCEQVMCRNLCCNWLIFHFS